MQPCPRPLCHPLGTGLSLALLSWLSEAVIRSLEQEGRLLRLENSPLLSIHLCLCRGLERALPVSKALLSQELRGRQGLELFVPLCLTNFCSTWQASGPSL